LLQVRPAMEAVAKDEKPGYWMTRIFSTPAPVPWLEIVIVP
jgi:hypothetical protein